MTELNTVIVGTKFRPRQAIDAASRLITGAVLTLRRDPDNKHDHYAIEVHFHGQHIGFVPKALNTAIALHMDGGHPVTAYVTERGDIRDGRVRVEPKIVVRYGE